MWLPLWFVNWNQKLKKMTNDNLEIFLNLEKILKFGKDFGIGNFWQNFDTCEKKIGKNLEILK